MKLSHSINLKITLSVDRTAAFYKDCTALTDVSPNSLLKVLLCLRKLKQEKANLKLALKGRFVKTSKYWVSPKWRLSNGCSNRPIGATVRCRRRRRPLRCRRRRLRCPTSGRRRVFTGRWTSEVRRQNLITVSLCCIIQIS